ncbi:general secretion pathway protein GspN [Lysobacter sp. SG-8]|uniref:General secretion pathway protein GspN n=1 Tax=Marilutibacter penaei TaxID=2759900 RepID=A0A7W3YE38_9GAMM|nr:general secretion pathway protein GspN [Lysobacter penaei]MBB1088008.1 general secretion pathway protein GspN [Lysobacter penaei]
MRLDNAGPRTWLLGGAAAWSVLALLLAFAGMGRYVGLLSGSEDDRPALPALPTTGPAPLGPLEQYAEIGNRPLFSDDRAPKPFVLRGDDGEEAEDAVFDYVLSSVLITPHLKMAIIQPADGSESVRVKLDEAPESHPAWRLVELAARSAVFEGPEGRRTMELRVFDGQGGAAPTAISRPADGLPAPPADAGEASPGGEPRNPGQVADADEAPADADAQPAMTPESQMEAIRQRIQARREALRQQAENRRNPPQRPTPPSPPSSPPSSPPPESR